MPKKNEPILPDRKAFNTVERKYPHLSLAEKYRLAQADTLIRLVKAESLEEIERMMADGSVQRLTQEHNQKMRRRKAQ